MPNQLIETVLKFKDDFSSKYQKTMSKAAKSTKGLKERLEGTKASIFSFKTAAIGLAGAAALVALKKAFDFATNAGVPFQENMSKLAAITGATEKEMLMLKNTAKTLGENSANSASQIAELQIELSKLGFASGEINDMADGINTLAIAIGSDLAQSSEAVGAILRQFSIDASNTGNVVDIMAESFSSSSLDLQKFQVAMGQLGPTAASMNFSLSETTAVLGKVVDSGIRSETAATGLRNIFADLRTGSGKLAKVLGGPIDGFDDMVTKLKSVKVGSSQFNKALEAVGKENQSVFISLLKNTDQLESFASQLKDSDGRAKEMSDTMADNVAGATKNLGSALEALGINLFDAFKDDHKEFLQDMTKEIKDFSVWIKDNKTTVSNWAKQIFRSLEGAVGLFKQFRGSLLELNVVAQALMLPFKNVIAIIGSLSSTFLDFFKSVVNLDFSGFGNRASDRLSELNESILANQEDLQIAMNELYTKDTRKFLLENEKKRAANKKKNEEELKANKKGNEQEGESNKSGNIKIFEADQKLANDLLTLQSQTQTMQAELRANDFQLKLEALTVQKENELAVLDNSLREEIRAASGNKKKIRQLEDIHEQKVDQAKAKSLKLTQQVENNKAAATIGALTATNTAMRDIFGENKALAIAQATIDTYAGATKAFAQGGTLGFITGGAIVASGLANVAKISGQSFNNGGIVQGLGTQDSNRPTFLTAGEGILTKDATNRIGSGGINGVNDRNQQTQNISNNITYSPVINSESAGGNIIDALKESFVEFGEFFTEAKDKGIVV